MKLGKEESYRLIRAVLVAEHFISDFILHDEFMAVKVGDLKLDKPPLDSDPDFEKKSLILKIKRAYRSKGINIAISMALLKNEKQTLDNIINICSKPQIQQEI
jgi:hypothetical protein